MNTVFVTKWLETRGIEECRVDFHSGLGVFVYDDDLLPNSHYIGKGHWHESQAAAEKKAAEIAARAIATHEKKIAALKKWLPSDFIEVKTDRLEQAIEGLQDAVVQLRYLEKHFVTTATTPAVVNQLETLIDSLQTSGREAGEK